MRFLLMIVLYGFLLVFSSAAVMVSYESENAEKSISNILTTADLIFSSFFEGGVINQVISAFNECVFWRSDPYGRTLSPIGTCLGEKVVDILPHQLRMCDLNYGHNPPVLHYCYNFNWWITFVPSTILAAR